MADELRVGSGATVETADHAVGDIQYHLVAQGWEGANGSTGVVPHRAVQSGGIGDGTESEVLHAGSDGRPGIFQDGDVDDLGDHFGAYPGEVGMFAAVDHKGHGVGVIFAFEVNEEELVFVDAFFAVEAAFGVDVAAVLVLILSADDPDSGIVFGGEARFFEVGFAAIPDDDMVA